MICNSYIQYPRSIKDVRAPGLSVYGTQPEVNPRTPLMGPG